MGEGRKCTYATVALVAGLAIVEGGWTGLSKVDIKITSRVSPSFRLALDRSMVQRDSKYLVSLGICKFPPNLPYYVIILIIPSSELNCNEAGDFISTTTLILSDGIIIFFRALKRGMLVVKYHRTARPVLWSFSVLLRDITRRPVTFEALRSVGKGYATKVRPVAPLALQNSLWYPQALLNLCGVD